MVLTRPSIYSLSDHPSRSQMRVTVALHVASSVGCKILLSTGGCMRRTQCVVRKVVGVSGLFFVVRSSVGERICSLIGYTTVLTRVPNMRPA